MRSICAAGGQWHYGGGGPSWFWGPVVLLLFFGFIAVVIWLVLRSTRPRRAPPRSGAGRSWPSGSPAAS